MSTTAKKGRPAPPAPASPFDAELGTDEKILWSGRPGVAAYTMAHARAAVMVVPFVGMAIISNSFVANNNHLESLGIVTWIFVAIALFYLVAPIGANLKARWFVFYALTPKRRLILHTYPKRHVKAFAVKDVRRVVAKDVNRGVGTLLIDADGAVSKNPARPRAGFYGVPYVEKLVEAVAALQAKDQAQK